MMRELKLSHPSRINSDNNGGELNFSLLIGYNNNRGNNPSNKPKETYRERTRTYPTPRERSVWTRTRTPNLL